MGLTDRLKKTVQLFKKIQVFNQNKQGLIFFSKQIFVQFCEILNKFSRWPFGAHNDNTDLFTVQATNTYSYIVLLHSAYIVRSEHGDLQIVRQDR